MDLNNIMYRPLTIFQWDPVARKITVLSVSQEDIKKWHSIIDKFPEEQERFDIILDTGEVIKATDSPF